MMILPRGAAGEGMPRSRRAGYGGLSWFLSLAFFGDAGFSLSWFASDLSPRAFYMTMRVHAPMLVLSYFEGSASLLHSRPRGYAVLRSNERSRSLPCNSTCSRESG